MPNEIDDEDIFASGESDSRPATYVTPEPVPMTAQEAEEYLSERNHLEHEVATLKAQYEAKLSPIKSALNTLNWNNENRLEQYIREEALSTGKKTFAFWSGTCRLRKVGGKPIVTDEKAAMEYALAESLEGAIRYSLDKTAYKKFATESVQQDGVIIPGVELEPERISFSVQFKAAGAATEEED